MRKMSSGRLSPWCSAGAFPPSAAGRRSGTRRPDGPWHVSRAAHRSPAARRWAARPQSTWNTERSASPPLRPDGQRPEGRLPSQVNPGRHALGGRISTSAPSPGTPPGFRRRASPPCATQVAAAQSRGVRNALAHTSRAGRSLRCRSTRHPAEIASCLLQKALVFRFPKCVGLRTP